MLRTLNPKKNRRRFHHPFSGGGVEDVHSLGKKRTYAIHGQTLRRSQRFSSLLMSDSDLPPSTNIISGAKMLFIIGRAWEHRTQIGIPCRKFPRRARVKCHVALRLAGAPVFTLHPALLLRHPRAPMAIRWPNKIAILMRRYARTYPMQTNGRGRRTETATRQISMIRRIEQEMRERFPECFGDGAEAFDAVHVAHLEKVSFQLRLSDFDFQH